MSLTDVFIRSISGYIFVIPGMIVYFLCLSRSGRKQTVPHIAAAFVFCYYIIGVLTMTGIGKLRAFSPRLTLIPFAGMISGPIDTLLNVVLFVPFGFFLPLLYDKFDRIGRVVWAGFLFSLLVEIVQMFGRGATDINDLITNTAGACLGYFVYDLLFRITKEGLLGKLRAKQISDSAEVLFFIVYAFVIMVTIQPWVIHTLFRLG